MRRHAEIPFWVCVGDVGDDAGIYEDPPAPLYWIKGNNENFDFVSGCSQLARERGQRLRPARGAGGKSAEGGPPSACERGWGPASIKNDDAHPFENLLYIPNGVEVEIDGLRVAGVGGTFAPTWYDKKPGELIKKGKDDKRRHFVREEVEAVKMMRGLDVLLTHEAPRPFRAAGGHDAGKTPINEMIAFAKPRLHVFGHHHRFVEMTVSGVRSVCLDLVSRSYVLIDRETLEYERRETPTV